MSPGFFLSLDGIDGAGKSTHCALLAQWLASRGLDVVACRDPGGTDVGERLRAILLDPSTGTIDRRTEMLLYMASRAQLTAEVIRPALEAGKIVLSDRFLLANVVYQGYGGGLDVDALWEVGRVATGGLLPHLTVVLDIDLHAARRRKTALPDRMEGNSDAFFQRVRDGFLHEARKRAGAIEVVDAAGTVEQIQQRIRDCVHPRLIAAGLLGRAAP
jgi:dTMP kinase